MREQLSFLELEVKEVEEVKKTEGVKEKAEKYKAEAKIKGGVEMNKVETEVKEVEVKEVEAKRGGVNMKSNEINKKKAIKDLRDSVEFLNAINGGVNASPVKEAIAKAIAEEEKRQEDVTAKEYALAELRSKVEGEVNSSSLTRKERGSLLAILAKRTTKEGIEEVAEAISIVEKEKADMVAAKEEARRVAAKERAAKAAANVARMEALKQASIERKEAAREEANKIADSLVGEEVKDMNDNLEDSINRSLHRDKIEESKWERDMDNILKEIRRSEDLQKEITKSIFEDCNTIKAFEIGLLDGRYVVSPFTKDLYGSVLTRSIKDLGFNPDRDLISISIADDESLRESFRKDYFQVGVLNDELYAVRYFGDNKVFCSLSSNEHIREDKFSGDVFKFLMSAPSGIKKGQWYMVSERMPLRVLMDLITFGGLDSYDGKELTLNHLVKHASGRECQAIPASVSLGKLPGIAVFRGEIVKGEMDGTSFLNSGVVRDVMSRRFGMAISLRAVQGNVVQFRNERSKTQAPLHPEASFLKNIRKMASEAKNVIVETFDNTNVHTYKRYPEGSFVILLEDQKYVDLYNEKGLDSILEMPIASFSDDNAIKADWKLSRGSKMNILAANSGRIKASTSVQILEKAFAHNAEGTKEAFKAIMSKHTERLYDELFGKDKEDISINAIDQDRIYVEGVINKLAPVAKEQDASLLHGLAQSLSKDLNKAFTKAKFPVEGANLTLQPDMGMLVLGQRLLAYDEVFAPIMEKIGRKEVTLFKYPTLGNDEFLSAKVVTLAEMKARINKLAESQIEKDILIPIFEEMSMGAIMVSSNNFLKGHLAGLDFDWDAAATVSEPAIVKIFQDVQDREGIKIVNIVHDKKADNKEEATYVVSPEVRAEIFYKQLTNKDLNVGRVTNINSTVVAMMTTVEEDSSDARYVLTKAFESSRTTKGNVNYEALPRESVLIDSVDGRDIYATVITVSETGIDNLEAQLLEFDFSYASVEQLKLILDDLNRVGRFYQESVIDQDKDLSKVVDIKEFFKNIEKNAKSILNSKRSVDFDWEKKEIKINREEMGKKVFIESPLSRVLDAHMEEFIAKVNDTVKDMNPVLDNVFDRFAREAFNKLDAKSGKAIAKLALDYNALMANKRREQMAITSNDDEVISSMLDEIETRYNKYLVAMENNFYSLTSNLELKDKSLVALYISLGAGKANAFARTITPELYIMAMMEIQAMVDGSYVEESKAYGRIFNKGKGVYTGMKSMLVDGNCEDGFFDTDTKYNGLVEVEGDKVFFVVSEKLEERVVSREDNGDRYLTLETVGVSKTEEAKIQLLETLKEELELSAYQTIIGKALNNEEGEMISKIGSLTNSVCEEILFGGNQIEITSYQNLLEFRGELSLASISKVSGLDEVELDIEYIGEGFNAPIAEKEVKVEEAVLEEANALLDIEVVEDFVMATSMWDMEELMTAEELRNKLDARVNELDSKIAEVTAMSGALDVMIQEADTQELRSELASQKEEVKRSEEQLRAELDKIKAQLANLMK